MGLPQTMKAVHQLEAASPKLTLSPSVPLPRTDSRNDHILKVMAVSPCLNELYWASFETNPDPKKERVPGTEASAIVAQAPEGSKFPVGTEVYYRMWTTPAGLPIPGSLRDYTIANEEEMAPKPKSLSWEEAAVVPLSSLTAWQGLFEHGMLDPRAITEDSAEAKEHNSKIRLLVTGATGGVGAWLLTLAKLAGTGTIIALGSSSKANIALSRGADEVITYDTQSIASWAKTNPPVDLSIDTVGGETLKSTWSAIKSGGTLLTISPTDYVVTRPEGIDTEVAKSQWYLVVSRGSELRIIGDLLDAGKIEKPIVDSVFEFEQYDEAFEKVQSRKTSGKVVIKVGV